MIVGPCNRCPYSGELRLVESACGLAPLLLCPSCAEDKLSRERSAHPSPFVREHVFIPSDGGSRQWWMNKVHELLGRQGDLEAIADEFKRDNDAWKLVARSLDDQLDSANQRIEELARENLALTRQIDALTTWVPLTTGLRAIYEHVEHAYDPDEPEGDSVGWDQDGPMKLTFGDIRRARQELERLESTSQDEDEVEAGDVDLTTEPSQERAAASPASFDFTQPPIDHRLGCKDWTSE